jgi:hypothetical protein
VEPLVVDVCHAVARAVDHINEVVAAVRLAEPVREWHRRGVTRLLERAQRVLKVGLPDEDVEVFGVALDPRIAPERICAADQDVEPGIGKRDQRLAVEVSLVLVENAVRIVGA